MDISASLNFKEQKIRKVWLFLLILSIPLHVYQNYFGMAHQITTPLQKMLNITFLLLLNSFLYFFSYRRFGIKLLRIWLFMSSISVFTSTVLYVLYYSQIPKLQTLILNSPLKTEEIFSIENHFSYLHLLTFFVVSFFLLKINQKVLKVSSLEKRPLQA